MLIHNETKDLNKYENLTAKPKRSRHSSKTQRNADSCKNQNGKCNQWWVDSRLPAYSVSSYMGLAGSMRTSSISSWSSTTSYSNSVTSLWLAHFRSWFLPAHLRSCSRDLRCNADMRTVSALRVKWQHVTKDSLLSHQSVWTELRRIPFFSPLQCKQHAYLQP